MKNYLNKYQVGGKFKLDDFWGWNNLNKSYNKDYTNWLGSVSKDPTKSNDIITKANLPYIKSGNDIYTYGSDGKAGRFHDFLRNMQPINPYQGKELSTEKQPVKFNATYVKSGFVKPTNTDIFNKEYENEIKTNGLQPTYKKYGYEADKELTMKEGGSLREYKYLKKGGQVKKAQGGIELSDDKYSSDNQGQLSQIGKNGIKTKKKLINKKK